MIRDFLDTIATIVGLLAFAFVAGAVVGAFFFGLFSIANMAPGS